MKVMIRYRSILELEQPVVVAVIWCHKMDRLMEQKAGKSERRMEQKAGKPVQKADKPVQKMSKPVAEIVELVKVAIHTRSWFLEPVIVSKLVQPVEQNCRIELEAAGNCSSCEPVISILVELVAGILLVKHHSCPMTGRNFDLMIHVHCYYNQIVVHKIVELVVAVGRKKRMEEKGEKQKSIQKKKVESKQTMQDREVDDCTMGQPVEEQLLLHNLKLEHRDYY